MIERHMTLTAGDANLETRSEVLLRQKKIPASIIPPMNIMGVEAVGSRHIHIWLLIGSGVIAAGQIGKAIISLPLIRSEMAVGFDFAGLIVAIFATLGAAIGIAAGVVVGRLGVRRALIGGMAVIGFGNLIGAAAENELVLLAARIVEGVGFFGAVLAIPTILAQIIKPTERDFVMGVWSAYMPAGIMLMLCVGPFLPAIAWRTLWLANAVLAAAWLLLLALYAPTIPRRPNASGLRFLTDVVRVVREPRCILLAFAFFTYSCQIFSLAFALPLLLTSAHGMSLGNAGLLSALVLAVSTVGRLLRLLVARRRSDLGQSSGSIRLLRDLSLCHLLWFASADSGSIGRRARAWNRGTCAWRSLRCRPTGSADPRVSATNNWVSTTGKRSWPVRRSIGIGDMGRASELV